LLQIGWSKVQELRRYIKLFRDSGKFTIAYMKTAGEKEYYLASAFQELVIAPTANIRLAGFSVAGGGLGVWLCVLLVRAWMRQLRSPGVMLLHTYTRVTPGCTQESQSSNSGPSEA
jgi:hypothetical protein